MCCAASGPWCQTVELHAAESQRAAGVQEHRLSEAHSCNHAEGMSHMEVNHSGKDVSCAQFYYIQFYIGLS